MLRRLLLAAIVCMSAVAGHAVTIFENSPITATVGDCQFECTRNNVGAENFSLEDHFIITDITFTVEELATRDLSEATVDWSIRTDANNLPGSILSSGRVDYLSTAYQFASPYRYAVVDVDITDTYVSAGDYWLTLQVDSGNGRFSSVFWKRSSNGDALSALSVDNGLTWTTPYAIFPGLSNTGFSFAINGIEPPFPAPIPASLPLLAVGLGGFWVLHRRQRT